MSIKKIKIEYDNTIANLEINKNCIKLYIIGISWRDEINGKFPVICVEGFKKYFRRCKWK